jgi:hypothetical protein
MGRWTVENVVVENQEVNVTSGPPDDQRCIAVGLLRIDEAAG